MCIRDSYISPGMWFIDGPFLVDGNLSIDAGTKLIFSEDAYLIVKGKVNFNGSENNQIEFLPKDKSWKGFYLISDKESKSIIKNLVVRSTSAMQVGVLNLTGGFTIYNSDILLKNIHFLDSTAEDSINIVNSEIEIDNLRSSVGKVPGLAVVQVGNVAASSVYVKAKTKSAKEVGIEVIDHHIGEETTEKELLELVNKLNNQENVNGILVQLPLPKHINEQIILDSIHPDKDADGFHPLNVGRLSIASNNDENLLIPCTPYGCLLMLKGLDVNLSGMNAVVVGRSNIVGKPMAQLLLKESCTVTVAHSKTKNLEDVCRKADIVVAAVGRPEMIKGDWIKKGAIVIDVGINKTDKGIVGDVAFDEVSKNAKALTPVPGGVGPMTIACLLKNTIDCFKRSQI